MTAAPAKGWLQRAVLAACIGLVRLFYRERSVAGAMWVPARGPCIVIANHPNGLIDPALLRLALQRPIGFLAKSTLFENPWGRLATSAFDAVPVYRARDGEDTQRNERTFELCVAHLQAGGWLALFPEGKSHSVPRLEPLKTGAARIALRAAQALPPGQPLPIVPVGLGYDAKETFRSRAAVTVGAPIDAADVLAAHGAGPDAVRALTARMAHALGQGMLQAANHELWRGLLAVAHWTLPAPSGAADGPARAAALADVEAHARRLAEAFERLQADDPAEAEGVVDEVRGFVRALDAAGVTDPLQLEQPAPGVGAWLRALAPLVLFAPVAGLGALLGWLPYRAIRPLAVRLARGETDLTSTLKLLLGLAILPLWYAGLALAAADVWGTAPGLGLFVLGPLSGFTALRWDERFTLRRVALHAAWLRATAPKVAAELAERRRDLGRRVVGILERDAGMLKRDALGG